MLRKRKSKLDELFPEREAIRKTPLAIKTLINKINKNANITNPNGKRSKSA